MTHVFISRNLLVHSGLGGGCFREIRVVALSITFIAALIISHYFFIVSHLSHLSSPFTHFTRHIFHSFIFIHSIIHLNTNHSRQLSFPPHSTLIYDQSGRPGSHSGNIWSFEPELVDQLHNFSS
jgi:hypothetical protein